MTPRKYTGLLRAVHLGRIIAEDCRKGDVPLEWTLRDVQQANSITFHPPYPEAKLKALTRTLLEQQGVELDD